MKECPFEPDLRLTRKKNAQLSAKRENDPVFKKVFSSASPKVYDIQKRTSSSERNEQILKKLKKTRYFQIFQGLLPDSMGYISKETVYKTTMPSPLLKILSPLLKELEELEEVLNFNEFYESLEILMKSLTSQEKNIILGTSKGKIHLVSPTELPYSLIFPSPLRSPVRTLDINSS
jgi:vesicle coat complex subunit